jgi:hypothetical protein
LIGFTKGAAKQRGVLFSGILRFQSSEDNKKTMALPSSDTTTTVPHRRSFTTSPPQPTTPYVSIRRSRIFVTKLRELSQAHVHESLQEQQRRQQQEQQLKHRQEQQRQQQRQREKSGKPLRTAFLQPIQTFLLDWPSCTSRFRSSNEDNNRSSRRSDRSNNNSKKSPVSLLGRFHSGPFRPSC